LFPFLKEAQSRSGWRDAECEDTLAILFGISSDTFLRDDEESMMDELQHVIDALQGKGSYAPRHGPYSMAIDISIDGLVVFHTSIDTWNLPIPRVIRWFLAHPSSPDRAF